MNMLTEVYTFGQAHCILEGGGFNPDGKPKDLYMQGIFVQGGVKNHNQRIYPVDQIQRAVDNINERIRGGESVLGECDHPEELNIGIDRVSHEITKMWMEGPNGMGKLRILPTPKGKIIRDLLEAGIKLGVSSRGSGNVMNNGYVTDFEIVTVDIVARPSAPDAYPKMVYETLNKTGKAKEIYKLAEASLYDPSAQKFLADKMIDLIKALKS